MLFLLSSLSIVVQLFNFEFVTGQTCNDCVSVVTQKECPVGYRLVANNEQMSLLQNAFCGYKNNQPRVCCTALGDTSLDSHPNLSLLPQDCGFVNGDRIVGGAVAGLYNFPWMALISHRRRDGISFNCGGTVINDKYILTAAHCIKDLVVVGVRVGEYDLRLDEDCEEISGKMVCEKNIQDFRVEEEIIHPEYQGQPAIVQNDIALLRLKKRIDFTPRNARPICLPVTSQLRMRDVTNADAVLAGWGFTDNPQASILQVVNVPVYDPDTCRTVANKNNRNVDQIDASLRKICAGAVGKDSCSGDSGGPLMITGQHNGKQRYIQHGVVSTGPRKCGTGRPGLYMDVTRYMKWILDTIKP